MAFLKSVCGVLMAGALVGASGPAAAYQLVLDGEDSNFRVVSGPWELDKTGTFQGNYRFSITGPGDGSSVAGWDIDSIPSGVYNVEFYVDQGDYAPAAEFVVESWTGPANLEQLITTTVTVSQQNRPAGWYSLGNYRFVGTGRVMQTDRNLPAGKKIVSDALRLTLQGALPPLPNYAVDQPSVSIVVDDLGALNPAQSGNYTHTLFSQAPQISYAIIPFLTYSQAVLADAEAKGIETMLHQPFQYIGQPDYNAGDPTRLYINMTANQIRTCLQNNFNNVAPYVWGMNNHQGSRFSQHRPGLEVAVDDLKTRGFYFLDSRTISDSVSYDIAKEKGILTAERDLFVDGTSVQNTQDLIESVGFRAMYAPNNNHVMICHQRPDTVPGILAALDTLETSGILVRRLDRNLHYIVEVDKQPEGASVELTGHWTPTADDMVSHECHDGLAYTGMVAFSGPQPKATFTPNLPVEGYYRIYITDAAGPTDVAVTSLDGVTTSMLTIGQRNQWCPAGRYKMAAGTAGSVAISPHHEPVAPNAVRIKADAVKFVYDGPLDDASVREWSRY